MNICIQNLVFEYQCHLYMKVNLVTSLCFTYNNKDVLGLIITSNCHCIHRNLTFSCNAKKSLVFLRGFL